MRFFDLPQFWFSHRRGLLVSFPTGRISWSCHSYSTRYEKQMLESVCCSLPLPRGAEAIFKISTNGYTMLRASGSPSKRTSCSVYLIGMPVPNRAKFENHPLCIWHNVFSFSPLRLLKILRAFHIWTTHAAIQKRIKIIRDDVHS